MVVAAKKTAHATKSAAPAKSAPAAKVAPAPVKVAAGAPSKASAIAHADSKPHAKSTDKVITEAHLLKMPAKDSMNDEQLAFFRHRLETQINELLSNAGETSEHLRETPSVPDPADRATIEEEHALELRTRDRERKLLKKIEQSIHRIEDGTYGYCDETGDPIGIPRLLARPTANLTIEAQQRRELRQKMYGD